MKKNTIALITLFIGVFALAGCQQTKEPVIDLSTLSLGEIIAYQAEYSDFYALIEASELTDLLTSTAPFTVFLPANGTFDKTAVLAQENLSDLVKSHILSGKFNEALVRAVAPATLPTLSGVTVTLALNETSLVINTLNITAFDVLGTNGVIHVVDGLLNN